MCEILVLKYNKENIKFQESAIEDALTANDDGAGYILLEKKGEDWIVVEIEQLYYKKPYYLAKTEKDLDDEYVFTKFELHDDDPTCVTLHSDAGVTMDMYMPVDVTNDDPTEYVVGAIERQCEKQKIFVDFGHKSVKEDRNYASAYGLSEDEAAETLYEKQDQLKENQMLIMHFRRATSGFTRQNVQPIIYGNFAVIHNGVFTGKLIDDTKDKSDTRAFTELLNEIYTETLLKSAKEEEEFLDTFLGCIDGWYSMFIYSWKSKKLYYRKKGANFTTAMDGLMYATKPERYPVYYEDIVTAKF